MLRPRRQERDDRGRAPAGRPQARRCRGRSSSDVGPLLIAARRHHPRLADRHDRDVDELRRPPRRRGRPEPGDDRHRRREHRRRARSRGSRCRRAAREPPSPSSPAPRASSPGSSARASSALLLLFFNSLLADLPQSALAAVVIAAALSLHEPRRAPALPARCADRRSCCRWWRRVGVIFFGVLQGIVIAIVLSILLFFRRSWWPHGAVLGRVDGLDGLAQRRALSRRAAGRPASSCTAGRRRCSSPTPARSASRSAALVRERQPRVDRPAVRGDHRRRRHCRRHARAARQGAQRRRGSHGLRRDAHPAPGSRPAIRAVRDARPGPLLPDRRGGARGDRRGEDAHKTGPDRPTIRSSRAAHGHVPQPAPARPPRRASGRPASSRWRASAAAPGPGTGGSRSAAAGP